eukprot:CAMPEP_0197495762 /NCGR_PEP_ID=MMETSP1311-20131121/38649_1 /TAXON_ID=464262 /ORGANISM="Genus nov. species nov., Strain RCC856" /LENGTH=49 /DNA_ID= /DNA_START= /DNA_END= /DNA_ORIENTATION=
MAEHGEEISIEEKLAKAFTKLDSATQRKQHKKALKQAEEILALTPEDAV